jgi:hypothetical protein
MIDAAAVSGNFEPDKTAREVHDARRVKFPSIVPHAATKNGW